MVVAMSRMPDPKAMDYDQLLRCGTTVAGYQQDLH
jgi:hypothetical protein